MRAALRGARIASHVVLVLAAIGVGLLDLSLAMLRTSAGAGWLRDALLGRINHAIAGRLAVARLRVVGPHITVESVRLVDPSGEPVVELDRLALRWSPWALLERRIDVAWLSASGPRLWWRRAADGTSNLGRALAGRAPSASAAPSRESGGPPGWSLQLGSLLLDGGLVVVRDERGGGLGRWRAEGIGGHGHGHWQARSQVAGVLIDLRGDVAEPRPLPFHGRLDVSANLAASGAAVDGGLLVELGDSELRLLATLDPVLPGPLTRGAVEVHTTVERLRLAPALARLLVPTWPLRPTVTGTGEARWNAETGEASGRLDLAAGKLRLAVVGTGDTRVRSLHEVELQARSIDLAELLADGVASDFSLGLAASVHAVADGWQGTAVLDGSGRLDGHALGPIHLRAEVDGERWRIAQARARLPGLRMQARGGGSARDLGVGVDLALEDLAALLTSVGVRGGATARGHGDLRLWLGGSPARPSLRLAGQLADLSWQDVRVANVDVQLAVPDVRRPLVANARLQAPDGQLGARHLRGLALRVRATGPRLDATLALAEPVALRMVASGVWQRGQRELRLDRCTVQADGTAWALSRPARLVLTDERRAVQNLRMAGQGAQSLALDLDHHGSRLDATLALSVALGRLPRALVPPGLRLGGDVRVEGELHRRGSRDELAAKVVLAGARVGDLDDVSLTVAVQARGRRVAGRLDGKLAAAQVAGRFDLPLAWPWPRNASLLAEADVAGVDLAAWRRRLGSLLASQAGATAVLDGVGEEVAGQAHVHALLDGSSERPSLVLSAEVARLRLRGVDLGDIAVHVDGSDAELLRATVRLTPHGDEREPAGRLAVEATLARPLAELLSPPLSIERLGSTPMHALVRLDRLAVKPLAVLARSPRPWRGSVDGSLALDGTLVAPTATIELSADDIGTDGVPPTNGRLYLRADEHGGSLTATVMRRGATLGTVTAKLDAPPRAWRDLPALADAKIAVTASVGPVAVKHAGLGGEGIRHPQRVLTGTLDGRLELGGTLRQPRLSLHTAMQDVRLDGRPMGQASVDAGYGGGRLQGQVHVASSNGGELQAQVDIDRALDLTRLAAGGWQTAPLTARLVSSRLDLGVLSGLSPRLRSVAGQLAAQVDVTGTVGDPQPSGSVEWQDGGLTLSGLGEYRKVHLQARGDRRQWILQTLRADSGEGHAEVRATGTRDDAKAGYDITSEIRLDRLPAYVEGQALADLSLDAKAKAEVARSRVRAQVDLASARLALHDVKRKQLQRLALPDDVVLVKGGQAAGPTMTPPSSDRGRAATAGAAKPAGAAPEPGVVVQVRGSHDLWIRSQDANIELGLDPGLHVEAGAATRIYGRVDVKRGIVNVVGRRFDLKAGSSVRFNGDPALPELDISAQHVNEGENVTVVATVKGTPGHLDTSITSPDRPDLTESQLYTLVVTGRLSLGGGSASAATPAQQAGSVLGGLLASQLQSVLAKKLPLDVLTIEGGNTAGSARVEAGKYLTSDFYVGYVGRLGADPVLLQNRNAVHLEYHLDARWSFQGEYGDAKTGSADVIWSRRY